MADFEIEDESGSYNFDWSRDDQKQTKGYFGDAADNDNDEYMYDFEIEKKKSKPPAVATFSPNPAVTKSAFQSNAHPNESAMQKAQNMLNKYSNKTFNEPVSNFKHPGSRTFAEEEEDDDDDDFSMSADDFSEVDISLSNDYGNKMHNKTTKSGNASATTMRTKPAVGRDINDLGSQAVVMVSMGGADLGYDYSEAASASGSSAGGGGIGPRLRNALNSSNLSDSAQRGDLDEDEDEEVSSDDEEEEEVSEEVEEDVGGESADSEHEDYSSDEEFEEEAAAAAQSSKPSALSKGVAKSTNPLPSSGAQSGGQSKGRGKIMFDGNEYSHDFDLSVEEVPEEQSLPSGAPQARVASHQQQHDSDDGEKDDDDNASYSRMVYGNEEEDEEEGDDDDANGETAGRDVSSSSSHPRGGGRSVSGIHGGGFDGDEDEMEGSSKPVLLSFADFMAQPSWDQVATTQETSNSSSSSSRSGSNGGSGGGGGSSRTAYVRSMAAKAPGTSTVSEPQYSKTAAAATAAVTRSGLSETAGARTGLAHTAAQSGSVAGSRQSEPAQSAGRHTPPVPSAHLSAVSDTGAHSASGYSALSGPQPSVAEPTAPSNHAPHVSGPTDHHQPYPYNPPPPPHGYPPYQYPPPGAQQYAPPPNVAQSQQWSMPPPSPYYPYHPQSLHPGYPPYGSAPPQPLPTFDPRFSFDPRMSCAPPFSSSSYSMHQSLEQAAPIQQQPLVLDLLRELRKTQEEAEWAKQALAEAIQVLKRQQDDHEVLRRSTEQLERDRASAALLAEAFSAEAAPKPAMSPVLSQQQQQQGQQGVSEFKGSEGGEVPTTAAAFAVKKGSTAAPAALRNRYAANSSFDSSVSESIREEPEDDEDADEDEDYSQDFEGESRLDLTASFITAPQRAQSRAPLKSVQSLQQEKLHPQSSVPKSIQPEAARQAWHPEKVAEKQQQQQQQQQQFDSFPPSSAYSSLLQRSLADREAVVQPLKESLARSLLSSQELFRSQVESLRMRLSMTNGAQTGLGGGSGSLDGAQWASARASSLLSGLGSSAGAHGADGTGRGGSESGPTGRSLSSSSYRVPGSFTAGDRVGGSSYAPSPSLADLKSQFAARRQDDARRLHELLNRAYPGHS